MSDSRVAPVQLAADQVLAHFLYGRDDVPTFPDDGSMPSYDGAFPPPGGCRLSYLTIAPGANQDYFNFIASEFGELADPGQPGFHRTPTLDLIIVVQGSLVLELDEGAVELEPGDTVIQNGTRHRWSNNGTVPAVIVSLVLGANADDSREPRMRQEIDVVNSLGDIGGIG
jgi:mannose-6-phosphate isomerase-like protein (cupin superfamily)